VIADTGSAILVLAVFVLPGFIALLFREWLYAIKGDDTPFERLLQALFNSAIIYALVVGAGLLAGLDKADIKEFYKGEKALGADFLAGALLFLIVPAILAVIGSYWMASKRLRPWFLGVLGSSPAHNTVSGWNELFSLQDSAFIRASLSDGRVVGGLYTGGSLAGYSEHTQDLYISRRWEMDDDNWFAQPAPRSLGVWLPRESIVSLDIYSLEEITDDKSTSE
jgi:TM2 domain-containing membrane protein YozV